ncbi:MAG TPA: HlyD family secretion protein [Acidobacteriaceae bacterium]|nr:HlyD family secretion protein [Acidobacteriaceae bacterium]
MSAETQPIEEKKQPEAGILGPDEKPVRARKRVNPVVLGLILIVLLAIGLGWYLYARQFEDTDDAQIDGHLNPIASRIDGTIKAVYTDDNQQVEAGKVLIELDPSDYKVALDQARAESDQAQAQLQAAHPNLPITMSSNRADLTSQQAQVASADAAVAAARHDLENAIAKLKESEANNDRSQADFARYKTLYEKHEVARADFDQYKAAAASQTQTVAANQASVASAQKVVEQREAQLSDQRSKLEQTQRNAPLQVAIRQADIKSQQAKSEASMSALEKARLNLAYCTITAPVSGVVTQRSAEVGARISAGQQLLMIVQTSDLWVTANFKETQLAHMHPGQSVRIYVDGLQKHFEGTVESMPAVTGSRTSVLPPENATGNYVKVVQRMPVRIRFRPNQAGLDQLRPGMSVEPKVHLD